jgi:phosphotransferase system  glucose/maltose/N-acetylglucosamine-specific IIC component
MIWLGWRQQRTETVIAAALLAVLAALLVPTGLHIAAAYDTAGVAGCLGHLDTDACGRAVDDFAGRFRQLGNLLAWLTVLPGVIGLLLAAPLVQQLEQRTHRLDWTQSITRGRWLAGKLALAVATALLAALALMLLVTWWRAPFVHIEGRMGNSIYDSEGTVVLAYALFALGLGVAIGAVWRRAVPALVVTFAGYFAVRVFGDTWLRQRLLTPVSATWDVRRSGGRDLSTAWVIEQHPVDAHGHALKEFSCPHNAGGSCAIKGGDFSFMHAVYQPASHFWPLQLRETALFAVAGLALLAFGAGRTAQS